MRVSVAIMAQRSRTVFLPYLREQLGPSVPVFLDPKTDRPPNNLWEVRRGALQLHDPEAAFHLVVQDDALIGRDFYPRLDELLVRHGDRCVYSLFYRMKSRRTHQEFNDAGRAGVGAGGFLFPRLQFGLAMALPVRIIPELVAYCDESDVPSEDLRMDAYLRSIDMDVWYPLPSLVDHRPDLRGVNGPNRGRTAWMFE